jgi:hypothetical protein
MFTLSSKRSYWLSLALLCSASPVLAGSPMNDSALGAQTGASPSAAAEDGLLIVVTTGPVQLEATAIREAIAAELGVKVSAQPARTQWGTVSVNGVFGPAVIVSYRSVDGATRLERRVPLPVEPKRRAQVVAWVVGNLVRNEAAEILDALRVSNPAPTDAPATVAASAMEAPTGTDREPSAELPRDAEIATASEVAPSLGGTPAAVTATNQHKAVATPAAMPRKSGERVVDEALESRVIQLSLWSPKLALYPNSERYRFRVNLGGGYNRIGGLSGVGLTWMIDRNDVLLDGVQISGLVSLGHRVRGVVLSGAASHATGKLSGAELSGAVTWRTGCFDGLQLGGALVTAGRCSASKPSEAARGAAGVQLSGAVAVAVGHFKGVQLSGATNVVDGSVSGLQLSSATNVATRRLDGVQLTGAFNYAGQVRGLQLGVVNVAGTVEAGGQLGIVNVAKDNHGFAYGLANWSRQVRIQPQYYFETPRWQNVGVRFLTGYSTASIAVGYDEPKDRFRAHYSFGGHLPVSRFALDAAIGYAWVLEQFTHGPRDRAHELDLRGTASFDVVPRTIAIFGGGTAALPVAGLVGNNLEYRMLAGVTLL